MGENVSLFAQIVHVEYKMIENWHEGSDFGFNLAAWGIDTQKLFIRKRWLSLTCKQCEGERPQA